MGTKKTTAKAAPAKGKTKTTKTAMLKAGDIWTHPDTGKNYVADVGECDETCAFGSSKSNHCNNCPITRDEATKRPICTENGVHLVEFPVLQPCDHRNGYAECRLDGSSHYNQTCPGDCKDRYIEGTDEPKVDRRYELISVDNIQPSPYQSRKDGNVSDLAASVRTYGVLNPVTVRANPDVGYEMIAGHRRWMAAQQAGLTEIPAIVIECDDQTAAEMCVTENMQRKDLSPIEEAEGVNALISTKHTLDDIANRLGRTRQWVARRASLVYLMPGIKARLGKADDVLAQAPVEVLEIMSRMPYDAQETLLGMFGNGGSIPSAATMRARAESLMCSLKNPAFSVKPCQTCTKRTGAAPDLFDAVDGKLGNCLDADCYAEKTLKAKQLLVEDLRRDQADVLIVTKDWQLQQKIPGVQSTYSHTECPKDAEDAVPAVEIKEDGNVRNFFVHKPVVRDAAGKVEQPKDSYETMVQKKVVKFVADLLKEWNDKLDDKCADEDAAIKTPFNMLSDNGGEREILRLIASFGIDRACCEDQLDDVTGYNEAPLGSLLRKLFQDFCNEMGDRLGWWKVEAAYPAAVIIAGACRFGEEADLVKQAKKELTTEGVADPSEQPKAKKGKK